jgi:heat shock protein HslJ/uncharacterized protein YraI
MSTTGHVIRRPQSTLIVYGSPPVAVYKLNQRDVPRIEQVAETALDFVPQQALLAAIDSLGVPLLALNAEDQAALAPLGYVPPAAPGRTPAGQAARPGSTPPVPPSGPGGPVQAVPPDENPSSGLRTGLVAVVIVLAAVVLLIFLLLSRLFSGPNGSGDGTATPDPALTATVTTTLTVTPGAPTAIALSNVSVRSGPGEVFEVIGVLPAGGSAAIIGRTDSSDWWQIQGANIQTGQGWVPADRVEARNAATAPVVASPPTPTPTPTPLTTFRGWKGEYFDNPNLQPPAVVVQDDATINFNWGAGAPAPGLPPNNFSVRWSRQALFEEGNYRIQVNVEGGVRLWLDGRPLIDDWQNSSLRVLEVDSGVLARGDHSVVVEYLKLSGNGQIAVNWQFVPAQPPTAIISGPSQGVTGQPLTFSAASSTAASGQRIVRYEWRFGDGSGADGVQVDKTYTSVGNFDVTLVVSDDAGLTGVAVQQVSIAAPTATPTPVVPPLAIISGPAQAIAGVAVTFDGSSSTPVGGITSFRWDFGDSGAATGATASHVFAQAGQYNVILVVTNAVGQSSQATQSVQVSAPQPTALPALPLEGPLWTLQNTLSGTAITASFQQGTVSGSGGCNTYSGPYSTFGSAISFGPLTITGLACDPMVMEQETLYLARLQVANEYQIEGNQLRLSGQIGDENFRLIYVGTGP